MQMPAARAVATGRCLAARDSLTPTGHDLTAGHGVTAHDDLTTPDDLTTGYGIATHHDLTATGRDSGPADQSASAQHAGADLVRSHHRTRHTRRIPELCRSGHWRCGSIPFVQRADRHGRRGPERR